MRGGKGYARLKVYEAIARANVSGTGLTMMEMSQTLHVPYYTVVETVNWLLLRGKVEKQCLWRVVT